MRTTEKTGLYLLKDQLSEDKGKKLYVSIYIKNKIGLNRVNFFVDNGSDITIMQYKSALKLFSKEFIKKHSTPENSILSSYTSQKIDIKFKLKVTAYFSRTSNPVKICINVIQDLEDVPHLILGSDMIRAFKGSISYQDAPSPSVTMYTPVKIRLDSYYKTEAELYSVSVPFSLGPRETKSVRCPLPPYSPVLLDDTVCTEWMCQAQVEALPSYSKVRSDEFDERYILVMLKNRQKSNIVDTIQISYQLSTEEKTIQLNTKTINRLSKIPLWSPCLLATDELKANSIVLHESPPAVSHYLNKNVYNISITKNNIETPNIDDNVIDLNYSSDEKSNDIPPDILVPKGYELPDTHLGAEDIVNLDLFPLSHRQYVKDIFLDTYPHILSKHSLHCGDISKTLGFYKIYLRPGVSLPNHRRIFNLAPSEKQHLKDLLSFMEANGIIEKVPINTRNTGDHIVGAPSFLVPRSNPSKCARLVIDYSKINQLVINEQASIPSINNLLHSLRGNTFFSVIDVSNAYNSYSISPDSRYITTFSTPLGLYQMIRIPTGLNSSPAQWSKIINTILHTKIVLDKNNKRIILEDNTVQVDHSPLENVHHFYDDIIIATKTGDTYSASLEEHFSLVKKVCSRLSDHNALIGFEKASLGRTVIKFLGHVITNNYIMPDSRRIEKLLNAKMPETRKGVRSFLGLANSMRNGLDADFMREIYKLTPLTGVNTKFQITDSHREAFEKLKKYLVSKPIFNNMIDPSSQKILFTDASSCPDSYYSAVLAQQVTSNNDDLHPTLCLDDMVNQVIYDRKLDYIPIPPLSDIYNQVVTKKELNQTRPPCTDYLEDPYFGYSENTYHNSLFTSTQIILSSSNCKIQSVQEMRSAVVKTIKKTELCLNIETFTFLNDKQAYREFMSKLETDGKIDNNLYCVDALARALHRHFIIISSLIEHEKDPIINFNSKIDSKPSFIYGLYKEKSGNVIFRPYRQLTDASFDIQKSRNQFEIIAYHTRSLPKTKTALHIFEHETYAVLSSLNSLKSYIGSSPLTLVTDSRALYLLYHQTVQNSSVKLNRYSIKLHVEFPNIKVLFTKSETNIADFLSKNFNVKEEDQDRISLKNFRLSNLDDILPTVPITIDEWKNIVKTHDNKLTQVEEKRIVPNLENCISSVETTKPARQDIAVYALSQSPPEKQVSSILLLETKLSYDELVKHQKLEFNHYIKACLIEDEIITLDKLCLFLKYGLLYVRFNSGPKLFIPNTLISILLAYFHLVTGHGGVKRLTLALTNFYFRKKTELICEICTRCLPCMLVNTPTKPHPLGLYPIPKYPFESVYLDLAENLNSTKGYAHLLIAVDPLSDMLLIFPLKTKKSHEVFNFFFNSIYQQFQVRTVISDNGACFSKKIHLRQLALLGVHKVRSSALNPKARGIVERKVGLVKQLLKKFLVAEYDYNWQNLHIIISKIINSSVCTKTGVEPYKLVFGHCQAPFGSGIVNVHPIVGDLSTSLQDRNKQLQEKTEDIKKKIMENQVIRNKHINKNRSANTYTEGNLIFVKDRVTIAGSTRPLRSLFSKAPYIITKVLPTTVCVKRLCDSFEQVYSKNDCKSYKKLSSMFKNLPQQIISILSQNSDFNSLNKEQIELLQRSSPIDFPGGLNLNNDKRDSEIDTILESDSDSEEEDNIVKSAIPISVPESLPLKVDASSPLIQPQIAPETNVKNDIGNVSRYNLRPRKLLEQMNIHKPRLRKKVRFTGNK